MAHDPALRRHIDARLNVLKRQRQSWEPSWRELSRLVNPRRGQFFSSPNQGGRGAQANTAILDPTALFALRTLVAGLMSGVTSPARPWFRLSIPDRRVASLAPVKVWLDECVERMRMVFNAGNLYSALPLIYEELGQFGTGCAIVEFDREDVIRLYTLSTGEYWLGLDWRGRVDTLARRFMYSYRQIEARWPEHGIAEISERARGADADTEIAVLHMIEPNTGYEKGRLDQTGKRFRSVYWREGGGQSAGDMDGEFIHCGGYSQFPALTPRWSPIGNDAYSKGPGHDALPDVKSLQILKKREHNAVDKHVNPPMGAHVSLRGSASSVLPGAINYFTTQERGAGMWPLYQTAPGAIAEVERLVSRTQATIKSAFFADLFLMISDMDGVQPRSQLEISARREEKMQMLGPVLENLHDDLLQPLVQRTFGIMAEHGLFSPPPPELHGYPLDVELISILAQAQKAADLGTVERLWAFAGSISATRPEVLDKLNADESIDVYADKLGAPASITLADDVVAQLRAARALRAETTQALQAASALAEGAKTLSETEVGGGRNALQSVLGA
ncbi:portal protein [Reyranella sp.]|uniref:portal protein n=1 Tax=Reyranella sp. TaxID=1929291 RepID=UPI004035A58E